MQTLPSRLKSALPLLMLLATSCNLHTDSKVQDFVNNRSAKNVALLIGAPTDLKGVATDIKALTELFQSTHKEFNFEVVPILKATKAQILAASEQYAAAVGDGGTLLWYFSGHGLEDGDLFAEDQRTVPFTEIAQAMAKGRQAPMRRLLVFIDSCFSGQMVNGSQAINQITPFALNTTNTPSVPSTESDTVADKRAGLLAQSAISAFAGSLETNTRSSQGLLATELVVMAASENNNTSLDLGIRGGAFTTSLRRIWQQLKTRSYNSATIEDLLKQAQADTRRSTRHHTPQFEVLPAEVAKQKLFTSESDAAVNAASGGPNALVHILLPATAGASELYASAPTTATRLVICRGDRQQCTSAPKADIELVEQVTNKTNVHIFAMPAGTSINNNLGANTKVTFLAVDAQTRIISARTVMFRPKS